MFVHHHHNQFSASRGVRMSPPSQSSPPPRRRRRQQQRHRLIHECRRCTQHFLTYYARSLHEKSFHKVQEDKKKRMLYTCLYCSHAFRCPGTRRKHMSLRHGGGVALPPLEYYDLPSTSSISAKRSPDPASTQSA